MESGSWLPARQAWEGTSPRPCPACARHSLAGEALGQGLEPKGLSLCFLPTRFILPCCPLAIATSPAHGCAPGLHEAWRPASDPPQPPTPQGLWRAEITGPTQRWLLLIIFHSVLECPCWRGPGSPASPAPRWVDRRRAHRASASPGPIAAAPRDRGLELGLPKAMELHLAPRPSQPNLEGPKRPSRTGLLPCLAEGQQPSPLWGPFPVTWCMPLC